VRAAAVADQQRVALRVVARAYGTRLHPHEPAIGVLAMPRRDALRDDRRAGVAADMRHLGAGVGLLAIVGDRDRIEFADRIVAFEDAARVLPGDRRAGFHLGPRDLRARAATGAALGHEIVDAALALGVARIPVLHGRIFDLRILMRDQFDDRGVQLVFIAL